MTAKAKRKRAKDTRKKATKKTTAKQVIRARTSTS
jgi:hypothetical protein